MLGTLWTFLENQKARNPVEHTLIGTEGADQSWTGRGEKGPRLPELPPRPLLCLHLGGFSLGLFLRFLCRLCRLLRFLGFRCHRFSPQNPFQGPFIRLSLGTCLEWLHNNSCPADPLETVMSALTGDSAPPASSRMPTATVGARHFGGTLLERSFLVIGDQSLYLSERSETNV